MPNRLADATSPYLLQHAENPVDWYEWGPGAFAEARRRDVPLLISVGYAACHWCHVMAHESFEDEDVARLMNELTVPVKVDREERPDVDAVYMTATQAMTGHGGWPMTVFATPEGEPFFCGTYFPKPNFLRLLTSVGEAWREQRESVVRQGRLVTDALAKVGPPSGSQPLSAELLDAAARRLHGEHDPVDGGFGGTPKFPPSMCLEFLLRQHARTGDQKSLDVVRHTCERMARGGMYDQLAGGFARYSVDAAWVVPHFEKMLYDNALLLRAYTHLWRATGDPLARRVARETVEFLLADLRLPGPDEASPSDPALDGPAADPDAGEPAPSGAAPCGFASALDADTEGVEGATYVWTPAQLREVLGDVDGDWAVELLGVRELGTFEHGTSVLQLLADPDDPERWRRVRRTLATARASRPQPLRDDKVVAAWNGLAITALVEYATIARAMPAGAAADAATGPGPASTAEDPTPELALAAAEAAARYLTEVHLVDGRLRRVSRQGRVGEPAGVLDDYGCVAEAFCTMHQVTGDGVWLERAAMLLDIGLELFAAPGGGFFDTATDAERLVARPAEPTDNSTPSGLTSIAAALTSYTALTGVTKYRQAAEAALATLGPLVARYARFTGGACLVGEALLTGPLEIAIAVPGDGGAVAAARLAAEPLTRVAWRSSSPGAVVVVGEPDRPGVPLLADRPAIDGRPTAYVCRGFQCDLPETEPDALAARLGVPR